MENKLLSMINVRIHVYERLCSRLLLQVIAKNSFPDYLKSIIAIGEVTTPFCDDDVQYQDPKADIIVKLTKLAVTNRKIT